MTRAMWLYLAGALACILAGGAVAIATCGCGGSRSIEAATADTTVCEGELTHAALTASSCNEAQFKVDAVIATVPACKGFAHFAVCALVDGGADGHD